jgi:hypothetical protein
MDGRLINAMDPRAMKNATPNMDRPEYRYIINNMLLGISDVRK